MKHRLAYYLLALLLTLAGLAPGQLTEGTVASQSATTAGGGIDTNAERRNFKAAIGAQWIDVTDYGAVGGAKVVEDAVLNGTTTVTSNTAGFVTGPSGSAGKFVRIEGGTAAGTKQVETFTAAGTIGGTTGQDYTLSVAVKGVHIAGTDGVANTTKTFSVTVVGGDTATIWGGKVRGALRSIGAVVESYDIGGSTTAITLTTKREEANDTDLIITVSVGTATNASLPISSANTTAGVARVDLVTTIASVTNSTTAVLADAAGVSGSGKVLYYGTDDTAAIASAIAAGKASEKAATIYFPGKFLFNADVGDGDGLHFAGIGGGGEFQDTLPNMTNLYAARVSVLMPALASAPVLKFDRAFGASVKNLMIMGSNNRLGSGVEVGDPAPSASGYSGAHIIFEGVTFAGFEYGLTLSRVTDVTFNACNWLQNRIHCLGGEHYGSVGPLDTSVWNGCTMSGTAADYCLFASHSKALTINGGDWILASRVIRAETSSITINALNCESTVNDAIELEGSHLVIDFLKSLSPSGPAITAYSNNCTVNFRDLQMDGSGNALWESTPIAYRCTVAAPLPQMLPTGFVMQRYSGFDFLTLMSSELTQYTHASEDVKGRWQTIDETFTNPGTSGHYGVYDWSIYNYGVGGTSFGYRGSGPGLTLGLCSLNVGSNAVGTKARFQTNNEYLWAAGTNAYWRFEFQVFLESGTHTLGTYRFGMYNIVGAPSTIVPDYGIGLQFDGSTDTVCQFEVINAGVVTEVPTTIPIGIFASGAVRRVVIERNSKGTFLTVRAPNYQASTVLGAQTKMTGTVPTGDNLAPAAFVEVMATGWQFIYMDQMKLTLFGNE